MSPVIDYVGSKRLAAKRLADEFLTHPQLKLLAKRDINTTFLARDGNSKLIIRIADKQSLGRQHLKEYERAERASRLAAAAGIGTRKVLLTGDSLVPYAYQVSEFIEGQTAEEQGTDEVKIWYQLGRLARRINSIKTVGFGDEPFVIPDRSWKNYISEHIDGVIRFQKNPINDRLRQNVRFSTAEIKQLKELMQPLKHITPELRLVHGDLGPHNVIVNQSGEITAVIDWDLAKSLPAAHQVALCTFWSSYQEPKAMARYKAFMKGYGQVIDPDILKAFQIYEYLTQLPYHSHQTEIQSIIRFFAGRYDSSAAGSGYREGLAASMA
jgi:Ser/Thr protein kinase RdoA (MazF antagonist)